MLSYVVSERELVNNDTPWSSQTRSEDKRKSYVSQRSTQAYRAKITSLLHTVYAWWQWKTNSMALSVMPVTQQQKLALQPRPQTRENNLSLPGIMWIPGYLYKHISVIAWKHFCSAQNSQAAWHTTESQSHIMDWVHFLIHRNYPSTS